MNWPFRSLSRMSSPASSSALPPDCESIEPLLPLYADGMASPAEIRLVETHLPGCEGCRVALSWMQATHRALASRPVAVPPANLHSRIAEAIAASSAAPVSLRPVRAFTLRPAYAAAASLTALGFILSYSLLHSPVPNVSVMKPAPKTILASAPPVTPRVKNVLPLAARVKPHQTLVARNVPALTTQHDAVKSVTAEHAPKKTVPVNAVAPSDRVAENVPALTHTFVPTHVPVKSVVHLQAQSPKKLMASANVTPAEKRHRAAPETALVKRKTDLPLLARRDKEPLPVQVHIEPATVFVQQPTVKTASSTTEAGGLLAGVNAYARAMPKFAYGKTSLMERQLSRGGTDAMHALDNEHSGYQPAVYTP